ncbi:MAG TPA: C2H2-type zinc finger protein [Nitrososphaeraceae archaeon]|nr:C2H2-type zinc finger protein [Nitrososphaeraceae archaeon]
MYTKQIIMSSEENQFKCEECGMVFSSQQELQQHANKEHVGTA